ncbi:hypothetical protein D9M69_475980 [compost metagenome]
MEAGRNQLRETLAGELQRSGHARPAVINVLPVGVAKSLGRCDVAVDQLTALLVTVAVQRRDHFGGEAGGFFEDAVDGFPVQPIVQPRAMAADIEHFVQHKTHVAQGSLILHVDLMGWRSGKDCRHPKQAPTIFEISFSYAWYL